MSSRGRKVGAVGLVAPFPLSASTPLDRILATLPQQTTLLPSHTGRHDQNQPYTAAVSLRGVEAVEEAREAVAGWAREARPGAATGVSVARGPVTLPLSYPHLFTGGRGEVAAMTTWDTGSQVGEALDQLAAQAARVNIGKLHRFEEAGLEEDEWREAVEAIASLGEAYREERI